MQSLSPTVLSIPAGGIRAIANRAMAMPGTTRLEIGEPDFDTPPHIIEAAHRAARDGFTRYTESTGLLSLREAISAKLTRVNGITCPPDRIIVTNGALSGLCSTAMALLGAGDEMLIPDPGWPNWAMMIRLAHAVPVPYPCPASLGFTPDLAALAALITPRTRAILINSPCNPTGAVLPAAVIEMLLEFARRHDLWVVSDECYDEIVFDGTAPSPAALDLDGRVITLHSCSKTYAMTGWRVGYASAPPLVAPLLALLQQPILGNVCAVAQKAAEAALTGPQDCVATMRDAYRARRDRAVAILADMGHPITPPAGAFYAMVDLSEWVDDTQAFAMHLLETQKIAVAPGDAFGAGGKGFVRLALCVQEQTLVEAIPAILDAARNWRNAG